MLDRVPGTLGRIARERAADYAGVEFRAVRAASGPSFREALSRPGLSVIAEVKRASPSQGLIAELDPARTAASYAAAGAAALSVLTEERHFGGRLQHLEQVHAATELPLLRKDFTVHPAQLSEAAAAGARAVLLIVAILGEETARYLELARSLGLDALVEVHDEEELDTALSAGTDILGINNRNLKTLDIDLDTAPRLAARARAAGYGGVVVAESGYRDASELRPVQDFADAVLIGTGLAGSGDPGGALKALLSSIDET
ncbi:MAG TPA: indole-3-glycerol phosphate synthase TrpC [Deinococcales bacterium]|nr:indole-3-glycerol phosphate synthase TrpC [Deinococcales bacterium]